MPVFSFSLHLENEVSNGGLRLPWLPGERDPRAACRGPWEQKVLGTEARVTLAALGDSQVLVRASTGFPGAGRGGAL